jgi:hypothetical protein
MPHLVVSISGHGFGHVAQTAPILNKLYQLVPQLHLTVRSAVPLSHLRSRIRVPFDHMQSEGDIGMIMSSALDVCPEKSREAYKAFHADWDVRVADEALLLRKLKAHAVFSNVGYLPLAGAQRAGIPNVALCSLNWFDIYRHYCGEDNVAAQIHACYANTDAFLRATPGMPMESLSNIVPVSPIANIGINRSIELRDHLHLSKQEKLILVSMGGIASRLPMECWPRVDGVRWLVQDSWQVKHPDATVLESLPMNFGDLIASCDVLLTKPGYGSFVEAACSGTPVLYVNRPDWPEAPALVDWLQNQGTCREVAREQLENGNIAEDLSELYCAHQRPPSLSSGTAQVTDWLKHHLAC